MVENERLGFHSIGLCKVIYEKEIMEYLRKIYKNKNVLITGHTGFKGSWLSILLKELGADITGYALVPNTDKDVYVKAELSSKINSYLADVRDYVELERAFYECQPDFVFHLAAQPLVRTSYRLSKETFDINVMGTINLLEILKAYPKPCVAVIITTDKCYENKESMLGYKEDDRLGGYDPYSASKACAELVVASYRNSFFHPDIYSAHKKVISTVRAGNVIGGGDWSEDRLIPDCIRAILANQEIEIRSPKSVRPWQHVLEPLYGYLLLAARMTEDRSKFSGAWNFGPEKESHISVETVVDRLCRHFNYDKVSYAEQNSNMHETGILCLDIEKTEHILSWKPKLSIDTALKLTADWYLNFEKEDVYQLCLKQIKYYLQ